MGTSRARLSWAAWPPWAAWAIGPSMAALTSSGMIISEDTAMSAAASMKTSRK
jgi:hypothetical protein